MVPKNLDAGIDLALHTSYIQETVRTLTDGPAVCLYREYSINQVSYEGQLKFIFRVINSTSASQGLGECNLQINEFSPFLTDTNVIYTMLHNLVKNGLTAQADSPGKVLVTIDPRQKIPDQTLFVPEGASNYKEFIPFHVYNQNEFPRDKNLRDYLTTVPERGERGFGLYFVGLAAKTMQMPVNIRSGEGKTTVSIYHPVYT